MADFTDDFESGLGAWDQSCDPDGLVTISADWSVSGASSVKVDQDGAGTDNGALYVEIPAWAAASFETWVLTYTARTDVADWAANIDSYAELPTISDISNLCFGDPTGIYLFANDNDTGGVYGYAGVENFAVGEGEQVFTVEQTVTRTGPNDYTLRLEVNGSLVSETTGVSIPSPPTAIVMGYATDTGGADIAFWIDDIAATASGTFTNSICEDTTVAFTDTFGSGIGSWDETFDTEDVIFWDAGEMAVTQTQPTGQGFVFRTVSSWSVEQECYAIEYTFRIDVPDWNVIDPDAFIGLPSFSWTFLPEGLLHTYIQKVDSNNGGIYANAEVVLIPDGEQTFTVRLETTRLDEDTFTMNLIVNGNWIESWESTQPFYAFDGELIQGVSVNTSLGDAGELNYFLADITSEYAASDEPAEITMPSSCEPFQRWWRFIVADMDGANITLFDRHARNRSITYKLNAAHQIRGEVSSADPQVNIVHTDGFPYLAEGDRLLYCLRREYFPLSGLYGWVPRAAGTILQLEDGATSEDCDTTFIAYSPWQYLYALPIYNPNAPDGDRDIRYPGVDINDIIIDLLTNADAFYNTGGSGSPNHTRIDYGQTIFYNGTIETLPDVDITFTRDQSVGEALDDLCALGLVDIVMAPIYDQVNRPGYLAELSIYAQAGTEKPAAIFSWDMPGHNVVGINRNVDGTQRGNRIRFHVSGRSGETITVERQESASIQRFGDYFQTQFFDLTDTEVTLGSYADELLSQVSEHRKTVSLTVLPQRGPDPFREWDLGDSVQVYATSNLRATQSGFQRVISFTLDIDDESREQVTDLTIYIPNESALVPTPEAVQSGGPPIQMSVAERAAWLARTRFQARRRMGGR